MNQLRHSMVYISVFVLALTSFPSIAQIYKWKDKDGNIHYGDRSKMDQSKQSELVKLKDKYAVPVVEALEPIKNTTEEQTRTLVLRELLLDLPQPEEENILIGRVVCGKPVDLYWVNGFVKLERDHLGPKIAKAFEKYGYSARTGEPVREAGELDLSVKIKRYFVNTCVKNKRRKASRDSSFIKLEWTIIDPLKDREVLNFESRGSYHGLDLPAVENGREKSFTASLNMAISNALANKDFAELISEAQDKSKFAKISDEKLNLIVSNTSKFDTFENGASFLKDRTAIIKTSTGHGSGVVFAEGGYVITNAHVVGDEKEVSVIVTKGNYKGKVLRKNEIRDAALIKIISKHPPSQVAISPKEVEIGESLFVIGTPLDMKFSYTITRGIASAKRKMQGQNYIQTDAAINFGNSGGPAFNKQGQLVAIAVSSVMTREGASLNINYLIPISDALRSLNIDAKDNVSTSDPIATITNFINKDSELEEGDGHEVDIPQRGLIAWVYNWLNQPLFSQD